MPEIIEDTPENLTDNNRGARNANLIASGVGIGATIGGGLLAIDLVTDLIVDKVNIASGYSSLVLLSAGVAIITTNRHTNPQAGYGEAQEDNR